MKKFKIKNEVFNKESEQIIYSKIVGLLEKYEIFNRKIKMQLLLTKNLPR